MRKPSRCGTRLRRIAAPPPSVGGNGVKRTMCLLIRGGGAEPPARRSAARPVAPPVDRLSEDVAERDFDLPPGVMSFELAQIGDVADVIAAAGGVDVFGLQPRAARARRPGPPPRGSSSCSRGRRRCCRPRPGGAPRRSDGWRAARRASGCCRAPACPCSRRPGRSLPVSAAFTRYDRNPCSSTPLCWGPVRQPPRKTPILRPK